MTSAPDPGPDPGNARAILRPALQAWLVYEGLWGAYYLVTALPAERRPGLELLGYVLTTLAAAAAITVQAWRDRAANPLFTRVRPGTVELCLLVGIAGALGLLTVERNMSGASVEPLAEVDAGLPLVLAMGTVALLPGVFEELLFRGVLLQRLQLVLGWPLAIAVQAMLFAVMHLTPAYLLPHFAFGCIAGFLRLSARALWPCILMHVTWNLGVVLLHYGVL